MEKQKVKALPDIKVDIDVDTSNLNEALAMVKELNCCLEEVEERLQRVARLGESIRRKERSAAMNY